MTGTCREPTIAANQKGTQGEPAEGNRAPAEQGNLSQAEPSNELADTRA